MKLESIGTTGRLAWGGCVEALLLRLSEPPPIGLRLQAMAAAVSPITDPLLRKPRKIKAYWGEGMPHLITEEAAEDVDGQHAQAANGLHCHDGLHTLVEDGVAGVSVALDASRHLRGEQ